ncbi:secondary thiamine-phosphate synthase enzyme YjbQ [Legionella nagasakiensis]|uniref:secondary thiamine-phosphate synthase enzyme YjbQ n=1 Tax=Legionella nagasakiensis TaxID=535290 RepID=UPI00105695B6|nr:secondary thiamine-phosphate synthase enzyme YjbQ [Legionella nagasakiensis]
MANATIRYWQNQCVLAAKPRGFHLITNEITQAMSDMPWFKIGLVHLFLQHTSASLTISENTCHDVRLDLEMHFNQTVPEDNSRYRHTLEGEDDMPAHIKNVILGSALTIPLKDNQLLLGQWQGIYLCEHRSHATDRKIIVTVQGTSAASS